jgi:outer membrane immunogenic protein
LEVTVRHRLILCGAAASFIMVSGAAAAQPTSAPDWSGPYIGLNGGYNWGKTTTRSDTTVNQLSGVNAGAGAVTVAPSTYGSSGRFDNNGWTAGGLLGLNIQSGPLVWGVEGDFDGMWARHGQTSVTTLPATGLTTGSTVTVNRSTDPSWIATVRGRLGFGLDHVLLYGTGGVAFADLRNRESFAYVPTVTPGVTTQNPGATYGPYSSGGGSSGVRTGWTAGGGVEFLASNNVTLGAEYRHTNIGSHDYASGSTGPNGISERGRVRFTDDAVLGRVTLKFSGLTHMF